MVGCFGLGRWNVADGLREPPMVGPVHAREGGELHGLEGPPCAAPVDDPGRAATVDALGQDVVAAVADAADGRLDAGPREAPGAVDGGVLAVPLSR